MSVHKNLKTILFTLDDFSISGVTSFVDSYARHLHNKGYHCVLLGEYNTSLEIKDYLKNCTIFSFHMPPRKNANSIIETIFYRMLLIYKFVRTYRQISKQFTIEAIHFNLTWSSISLLLFCPDVYWRPRVITFYGDLALETESRIDESLRRNPIMKTKIAMMFLLQRLSLLLNSRVITFSNYAKRLIIERHRIPSRKIVIIPGAINKSDYDYKYNNTQIRNEARINLVNISRFEPRKGHDLLLRAIDVLIKKHVNVFLSICGPIIPEMFPLLKLYEDLRLYNNVRFVHYLSPEEKRKLISQADLFVMPSRELETFGLTIIESLACGTPVIGTPVGAIPEVLSLVDGRLITKTVSHESIARAIIDYMRLTQTGKNNLKKKCQHVAFTYFDSKRVYRNFEQLYKH